MEDFAAGFIRRLGGIVAATSAVATTLTGGLNPAAATVEMGKPEDCILELKYFRLSHTRTLKESYRFNVWQSQTFLGPNPPSSKVDGHIVVGKKESAATQFYWQGRHLRSHSLACGFNDKRFLRQQDMGYPVRRTELGAGPELFAHLRAAARVPVLAS